MSGADVDGRSFGELVREHRHAAGLTQEALAEAAGLGVRTVRTIESGRVAPQRRTVELFADGLGLRGAARAALVATARLQRRSGRGAAAEGSAELPVNATPWLPPTVNFVGRHEELAQLIAEADHVFARSANRTLVVTGQPGVGKTALLTHVAHELRTRLTDPVHFVDLAGTDDVQLSADGALEQLLGQLGVQPELIPQSFDERVALYRIVTAERGGVLILDDAVDERQVRPLLSAGSGWLVLISSRRALAGLTDIHRIALDLPSLPDAIAMLDRADDIGSDADRATAAELVERCGRLPLALRVASALLDANPSWTIEGLAARLADERHRLDVLHVENVEVRSAFAVSYRQLTDGQRTLLRGLATVPWREYSIGHAAALGGIPPGHAEDVLEDLTDAGLLSPSAQPGHYQSHDLIRLFGAERAADEDAHESRAAALERVRAWLIDSVVSAGSWIAPTPRERPSPVSRSLPGLPAGQTFGTGEAAVDWLTGQREAWYWAIEKSAEEGRHRDVIEAETALHWYADRYLFSMPWERISRLAVAAAVAVGDPRAEAERRNSLGWYLSTVAGRVQEAAEQHLIALEIATDLIGDDPQLEALSCMRLGRTKAASNAPEDAIADHERAVRLFEAAGDSFGAGLALLGLGRVWRDIGDPAKAIAVHLRCLHLWENDSSGSFALLPGLGHVRLQLGHDHVAMGRPDEAERWFTEAAERFTQGRAENRVGDTLLLLGTTLAEIDPTRAEQNLRRAADVLHATYQPLLEATALHRLGGLRGIDHDDRVRVWHRAADLCANLPNDPARALHDKIRADLDDIASAGAR